ncbi:leucine-rich repeat domain-containing protein [Ruminococcus sp.]|uniref:leucine-rich repeat domain-containing protein n=1 Tax=Ruminococcus sp. TaxID=41978 RepID=UPI0025DE9203|nr:leucine-rich repeat domain-containing protein [Ruminococcus sp.]MBR1433098.1 leucine-rich repeat domain-containing protein [Ruminococcus sp.]
MNNSELENLLNDVNVNVDIEKRSLYISGKDIDGTFLENSVVEANRKLQLDHSEIDLFQFVEAVYIQEGTRNINIRVLRMFPNMKSLSLPDSITDTWYWNEINFRIFEGFTKLEYIKIPAGIQKVNLSIFEECTNLKDIYIPAGIIEINQRYLNYKGSLYSITVDQNNPVYSSVDGVLFSKDGTRLISFPVSKIGKYIIPPNTKVIEKGAFSDSCIEEIVINSGTERIEGGAFRNCRKLHSLFISDSVRYISPEAVGGCCCSNLYDIKVSENNSFFSSVNGSVFTKDKCKLRIAAKIDTEVFTVPESVLVVGTGAFNGTKYRKIVIPDNVMIIEKNCFDYCEQLEEIVVCNPNITISESESNVFSTTNALNRLKYYSASPDIHSFIPFGRGKSDVVIAPNVKLSSVSDDFFPAFAAGFIEMVSDREAMTMEYYQDSITAIKDHISLLEDKMLIDIGVLDFILNQELLPIEEAKKLYNTSLELIDLQFSVYLKEYIEKYS